MESKKKNEKGQSLAELMVSLTFMLVLLAGIVDLGRAFFTYIALRDAAQEGAIYGSVYPNFCEQIVTRVRTSSDTPVDLGNEDDVTVDVVVGGYPCGPPPAPPPPASSACLGNAIEVSVSYANFPITMPFLGTIVGSQTIGISADARDTILSPSCP